MLSEHQAKQINEHKEKSQRSTLRYIMMEFQDIQEREKKSKIIF